MAKSQDNRRRTIWVTEVTIQMESVNKLLCRALYCRKLKKMKKLKLTCLLHFLKEVKWIKETTHEGNRKDDCK